MIESDLLLFLPAVELGAAIGTKKKKDVKPYSKIQFSLFLSFLLFSLHFINKHDICDRNSAKHHHDIPL